MWDGKHAAIRALKFQEKKEGLASTSCSVITVLMDLQSQQWSSTMISEAVN